MMGISNFPNYPMSNSKKTQQQQQKSWFSVYENYLAFTVILGP